MNKSWLVIPVVLLIFGLSFAGDKKSSSKKVPNFKLKDLKGKTYQLYDNLGKGPIVINFWATWCVPCVEEIKKMKKYYKEFSEKGVQFLAISVDDPKTVSRVRSFVKSHRLPFQILLDTNNDVLRKLQGTVPPYTLVLDKEGKIVYTHVGYRIGDEKKVKKELEKLLK